MPIMVSIWIGAICWGFAHVMDAVLELKRIRDIPAVLPPIPVITATVIVIGVVVVYLLAKGSLTELQAEAIVTIVMVSVIGLIALEIFGGKRHYHEVIRPPSAVEPIDKHSSVQRNDCWLSRLD